MEDCDRSPPLSHSTPPPHPLLRFYGESLPLGPPSTAYFSDLSNLALATLQQALEDAVLFIQAMQLQHGCTARGTSRSRSTRPVEERQVLRPYGALFSSLHPIRPVEERHDLRSYGTLFPSVHPNDLRFPWTLGTLFPSDNQTSPSPSPSPPWNIVPWWQSSNPDPHLAAKPEQAKRSLREHGRNRVRPTTTATPPTPAPGYCHLFPCDFSSTTRSNSRQATNNDTPAPAYLNTAITRFLS
jgi:hypothetical protein